MHNDYFDQFFEAEEEKPTRSFLEFVVSGKTFAVELSEVRGVFRFEGAKSVPQFPDYVAGVCAYNDETIAVIEPAKRFGYSEGEGFADKSRRCVVVTIAADEKGQERSVGLLVDAAKKIRAVEEEKVAPAPQVNRDACTRFVIGSYRKQSGEICLIVSPELMMSDEEKLTLLRPIEK